MHALRRSSAGNHRHTSTRSAHPISLDLQHGLPSENTPLSSIMDGKPFDHLKDSTVECTDSGAEFDHPNPVPKKRPSKSMSYAHRLARKPSIIEKCSSCWSKLNPLSSRRLSRKQSGPDHSLPQNPLTLHNRSASHANVLVNVDRHDQSGSWLLDEEAVSIHEFLDPSPGAAARAAAASANQIKARSRSTCRLAQDGSSSLQLLDSGRESGISLLPDSSDALDGLDVEAISQSQDERLPTPNRDTRTDPLSKLPNELCLHVLSFLDAGSLNSASLVSRTWAAATSDQQVWKTAFLDRFAGSWPPGSHPLPIGGQGVGRDVPSGQDWRRMHKARVAIEENWRLATTPEHFQKQPKCHTVHIFGHTDSVYCVQFDEHKIITGSRDRTIRVWDLETYKCTKIIGCPDAIDSERHAAKIAPRTPMISGLPQTSNFTEVNEEPDADIWHVPDDYHTASILCMQYDSEIAVTGSSDSTLIIWDIEKWQPIRRLRRHRHGVLDLAFDEEKIVSCSKDYTLCVWDRKTGELLTQLAGHQGPVNAVQLRGNLLVSASGEGTATLWNLNFERAASNADGTPGYASVNATVVRNFSSRDRGLACVEFSDDAKYVLAGGNDQVIFKYDASTGSCIETINGHRNLVRSLYLDGMNKRVISGSYDMSVRVWDWATGEETCHFPEWATSWILSAKSDYRRIVGTSQDGRVLIFDFGHNVSGVDLLKGS